MHKLQIRKRRQTEVNKFTQGHPVSVNIKSNLHSLISESSFCNIMHALSLSPSVLLVSIFTHKRYTCIYSQELEKIKFCHLTTWVDLESIIQSEKVRWKKSRTRCFHSYVGQKTRELTGQKNKQKLIDTDDNLMVTRGKGGKGR